MAILQEQKEEKAAAKVACEGITSITKYFTNNSPFTSSLDNPINIDDLINLDEIMEKEGFNFALEELNTLIKDNSLVSQVKNWLQLILQYINLKLVGYKCMKQVKPLWLVLEKENIKHV